MGCDRECNCVEQALGKLFYKYGLFLAKHPWPFVIVPPMVTMLLAIGLTQITVVTDTEYLYAPTNAPAKGERALVQELFPENDTHLFTFVRQTEVAGFLHIIITNPSESNMLTNIMFQVIYEVDEHIRNIQVTYDGKDYVLDDGICAKWMDTCAGNELLDILQGQDVENISLTFPVHNNRFVLTHSLLSVITDDNQVVESAKAIMLAYHGRYLTDEDRELTDAWFEEAKTYLLDYTSDVIDIVFQTSNSLNEELNNSVASVLPLFSATYVILLTFAVFSALMLDWVRAKPFVALAGEGAAVFGIVSSLGFMCACGIPFPNVVGTMPFLIIGIGLDDLFIIISAWRYTDYTLGVPERVALTFKSAAVSITFTSLTDVLAFCAGAVTNFKSVQLYCAYTGVAVIFTYIYMITFTGAILVFSGQRESENRHALTFKKITHRSCYSEKSRAFRCFCTGGDEKYDNSNQERKQNEVQKPPDIHDKKNITEPVIAGFLTKYLAPLLMRIPAKICVLVLYAVYISISIWGCTYLEEGLDLSGLAPDDSYLNIFYTKYYKHFRSIYGPVVMTTLTDSLDYTDSKNLDNIDEIVLGFKRSEYFYSDDFAVNFWLYSFQYYLSLSARTIENNITSMTHLISSLRTDFLSIESFQAYKQDIIFNSDFTEITSSRFFIQSIGSYDTAFSRGLLVKSREIAEASQLSVSVFSPFFVFYDQFDVILVHTMQNLAIAVGAVLILSLLFIPSLVAVFWVTVSMISICTGVIGFMALWDVSLDSVSMINLIMSIGFSVDFVAHITYHFVICKESDPSNKVKEALGHLGTPIFQGALSTVLGVVILAASNSYIFRTAFKIIFLVMVFGCLHALVILPVILSYCGVRFCRGISPAESKENNGKLPRNKEHGYVNSIDMLPANEQLSCDKEENIHMKSREILGPHVTKIDITMK